MLLYILLQYLPNGITWYEFTKDIVIPFLGVVTTIVVGAIIAYLLKNKEEKAKIKTLLIDHYMLYLNHKLAFFEKELNSFTYRVFSDLLKNYASYFTSHANDGLVKQKIIELRNKFEEKMDLIKDEDSNWTPFTFRFGFLLGKKRYIKKVQQHENNIIKNYLSDTARDNFFLELKKKITLNQEIVDNINSYDFDKVDHALDKVISIIAHSYSDFQFKLFNPFETQIANLVSSY